FGHDRLPNLGGKFTVHFGLFLLLSRRAIVLVLSRVIRLLRKRCQGHGHATNDHNAAKVSEHRITSLSIYARTRPILDPIEKTRLKYQMAPQLPDAGVLPGKTLSN